MPVTFAGSLQQYALEAQAPPTSSLRGDFSAMLRCAFFTDTTCWRKDFTSKGQYRTGGKYVRDRWVYWFPRGFERPGGRPEAARISRLRFLRHCDYGWREA